MGRKPPDPALLSAFYVERTAQIVADRAVARGRQRLGLRAETAIERLIAFVDALKGDPDFEQQ